MISYPLQIQIIFFLLRNGCIFIFLPKSMARYSSQVLTRRGEQISFCSVSDVKESIQFLSQVDFSSEFHLQCCYLVKDFQFCPKISILTLLKGW